VYVCTLSHVVVKGIEEAEDCEGKLQGHSWVDGFFFGCFTAPPHRHLTSLSVLFDEINPL
jgi:hypothetical protein